MRTLFWNPFHRWSGQAGLVYCHCTGRWALFDNMHGKDSGAFRYGLLYSHYHSPYFYLPEMCGAWLYRTETDSEKIHSYVRGRKSHIIGPILTHPQSHPCLTDPCYLSLFYKLPMQTNIYHHSQPYQLLVKAGFSHVLLTDVWQVNRWLLESRLVFRFQYRLVTDLDWTGWKPAVIPYT